MESPGYKTPSGNWTYGTYDGWASSPMGDVFGGIDCRPAPADYDGDGLDDLAVLCPGAWKIAYSTDADNLREIQLDEARIYCTPLD